MLLNEGGGEVFEFDGRAATACAAREKGIFRFKLTAHGVAGHASLPRDRRQRAAQARAGARPPRRRASPRSTSPTARPACCAGSARIPSDPQPRARADRRDRPGAADLLEPMLGVTLTPTMVHASDKINVIPSRAYVKVDCRVPPGPRRGAPRGRRIEEVLGEHADQLELEFTETVTGNSSPVADRADVGDRRAGSRRNDPGAETVPVILPGFSDSRWFREAFPDCVAYGFFPQRHMTLLEAAPLVHSADERIDVRDLGFAARLLRRPRARAARLSRLPRRARGVARAASSPPRPTAPDADQRCRRRAPCGRRTHRASGPATR